MKKKFTYKAFGLIFNSDFEIPELLTGSGDTGIKIELGKTPNQLQKITNKGVKYEATKNEFLLQVDHIARYYVQDGEKITIELLKDKVDKEVRLFLLGSAFGSLFLQRGLLPIHGSSIKFKNFATIFTGLSGVGKSTIAAHFVKLSYQALADDISVINHQLQVAPGFPSLKIWNDVLEKLEIDSEKLNQIRPNFKKFRVPVNEQYYSEPVPLKNIVILSTKNSPGFEIEELNGIKKFTAIKNNTYRYRFVQGLEKQLDHFQILDKLLPKIKVYKVSKPQAPLLLDELGDFLLQKIELNV